LDFDFGFGLYVLIGIGNGLKIFKDSGLVRLLAPAATGEEPRRGLDLAHFPTYIRRSTAQAAGFFINNESPHVVSYGVITSGF
jgi:hypothetical protein